MFIKGIGNVKKEIAMSILTEDGKEAVKSGDITTEELGEMYKLHCVKKESSIGNFAELFAVNYERIPEKLTEKLSPEDLASLVDAFYKCYGDGKNAGNE